MIDTIVATYNTMDINGIVKNCKPIRTLQENKSSNVESTYKLNNLTIKVNKSPKTTNYDVTIMGSLNKYIHGNNIVSCTQTDIEEGIQSMSELLHLPVDHFDINRIDIGKTFVMDYAPSLYNLKLSHCGNYKKSMYNNFDSLYFRVDNRELIFYDKKKEFKPKYEFPTVLSNNELLRYEYKLRKKIRKELKRNVIKGKDLYEPNFYRTLLNKYEEEYFSITRNPNPTLTIKPTVKKLGKFLSLMGIQKMGGVNETQLMINNLCKEFKMVATEKKRLKDKVKELTQEKELLKTDELLEELDRKVRRSVEFGL